MTITIEIKNVYGRETIYPACHISEAFAAIAGTKTLTRSNLQIIKAMGYAIEMKPQTFKI